MLERKLCERIYYICCVPVHVQCNRWAAYTFPVHCAKLILRYNWFEYWLTDKVKRKTKKFISFNVKTKSNFSLSLEYSIFIENVGQTNALRNWKNGNKPKNKKQMTKFQELSNFFSFESRNANIRAIVWTIL